MGGVAIGRKVLEDEGWRVRRRALALSVDG